MIIKKQLKTNKHEELIDITHLVSEEVAKSGIKEGYALVYVPHTTAGVTINENADPDVRRDILTGLRSLDFESISFSHMEGNSPGHLKSSIIGCSISVIIENSKLLLGTWQGIYFCEFDGPRTRSVVIQIK
ncbi:MAG: YjbQ family protein [Spirochaetes bacterium]|nr:YjbQ family protein [Spirochaetota bacterium]